MLTNHIGTDTCHIAVNREFYSQSDNVVVLSLVKELARKSLSNIEKFGVLHLRSAARHSIAYLHIIGNTLGIIIIIIIAELVQDVGRVILLYRYMAFPNNSIWYLQWLSDS